MKHISKFDGCVYEIGYAMTEENGKEYSDDIYLIWKDPQSELVANDADIPIREFINWYCGDYDYETTEWYIKDFYKKKFVNSEQTSAPQKQSKTLDLPICYVNFIGDCLDMIKKHNLYSLLSYDDDCVKDAKDHLEEVLEGFCKPLEEYGDDTEIILEV